jgi:hypothetical protein
MPFKPGDKLIVNTDLNLVSVLNNLYQRNGGYLVVDDIVLDSEPKTIKYVGCNRYWAYIPSYWRLKGVIEYPKSFKKYRHEI